MFRIVNWFIVIVVDAGGVAHDLNRFAFGSNAQRSGGIEFRKVDTSVLRFLIR